MKVFVIFLVLLSIATLIPHTFGSGHNQDMGFFYLPLTTESKNHHILAQSTSANFVNAFYDSSLNSLLASISSVNSEDIISITMTYQTYWELFTGNGEKYVGGIQVLIDGDVRPYKKIQDDNLVTYLFKTPPNSGQIEIRPSTLRMGVDNVPDLEKLLDTLPLTYPPLKQSHLGIPFNEIQCRQNLVLVQKYDGSPACVTESTKTKLVEREWSTEKSPQQTTKPETKSIITINERIPQRTIVPITVTQITNHVEPLDTVTYWGFTTLGIKMETLGDYWGNLPPKYETHIITDQNGNEAVDYTRVPSGVLAYKLTLWIYPATCDDGTKVKGEGGYPEPIPIKGDVSTVFFNHTGVGLYPDDDGNYSLEFVSGFETNVEFPQDATILSQETKQCSLDNPKGNFTDVYYTNTKFRFD